MLKKIFNLSGDDISVRQAYVLLATTVLFWAIGIVIARGVREEIPLIGLSFWRWFAATLILIPFVYSDLKNKFDIVKANLRILTIQGFLMIGSGTLLFYALNYTTAINATIVNATQPVVTVAFAWLILGDRLKGIQMLGIVSAFVGIGVMISRADLNTISRLNFNIGDLLIIIAIMGYALYSINIRKMPKDISPFTALSVILFAGSMLILPFYVVESIYVKPFPVSLLTISIILILALLISIASLVMWNLANSVVGPGRAGMFVNLIPVYGTILAITFLGESLFIYHVIGTALVCVGIFLVLRNH
ncbi:MAG: DMT family transporter [Gammaproteobacteria bacterium]|jgi:drug/metabolite transporter (DMT)-like permease|nr:DMT family transporter [Gammaproteobacteria bacterium]